MARSPIIALLLVLAGCNPTSPTHQVGERPSSQIARPGIEGSYIQDDPAFYGAKTMGEVPPGQVMRLFVKEGRWMMANMLSAWGGPYTGSGETVTFRTTESPSGPVENPQELAVSLTDRGLEIREKGGGKDAVLRFTRTSTTVPGEVGFDEFLGPKK